MATQTLASLIAQQDFFKGMRPSYVDFLAGCAKNTRIGEGEYVFESGGPAEAFYLIRRGKVALEYPAMGAITVTIQTLDPGEVLGWSWSVPPYRWHLSARAVETVTALAFDAGCVRKKFETDPAMGYEFHLRLTKIMSARLENTFAQMIGICGP